MRFINIIINVIATVDAQISSYLIPGQKEIVSSRGRDGQEVIYKTTIDPIVPSNMPLVVLVNGASASASEIVSGAIQDLDAGVIMGPTKTYGKGLVQKLRSLPLNTALKYTVAKYYTPSGRCIQSVNYQGIKSSGSDSNNNNGGETSTPEGGGSLQYEDEEGKVLGSAVKEADRKEFRTAAGRIVRDGGGIEPDVIVTAIKAGPAESR